MDRQGDALLALTFADFIKDGDLDRHIKTVLKIDKARRDKLCKLLKEELGTFFRFDIPKGGMAVWVTLDKKYTWEDVAGIARTYRLEIGDWQRYDIQKAGHNSIRIGFAGRNEDEIGHLIDRLKKTMHQLRLSN